MSPAGLTAWVGYVMDCLSCCRTNTSIEGSVRLPRFPTFLILGPCCVCPEFIPLDRRPLYFFGSPDAERVSLSTTDIHRQHMLCLSKNRKELLRYALEIRRIFVLL